MIHLQMRYVKPEHVDAVSRWLTEVDTVRRSEAVATLVAEGIRHEQAHLLTTSDGAVLVYALETDDLERARRVADGSTAEIDRIHRATLRAADGGPVPARRLLDLLVTDAPATTARDR